MRTQVNREELRREWVLESFWDKLVYGVGVFFSGFMAIAFLVGFIDELIK